MHKAPLFKCFNPYKAYAIDRNLHPAPGIYPYTDYREHSLAFTSVWCSLGGNLIKQERDMGRS